MQQKTIGVRGGNVAASSVLAAVLAVTLMAPLPAFADPTSSEKQAEAQAALASLNSMQQTLNKASDDYFVALDEQSQAEANRDAAQQRIDEVSAQISDLQERLGSRATSMYRSGNTSFIDLLLGATSFSQFATNWDILVSINESDAQMVAQTKELKAEAEQQEAEYAEQERIATEKAQEAERIKNEAESTVASMQATYDSLSAEAAALLEQERAAQAAAEAAAAQAVIDAAKEAAEQQNNPGGNTNTPNTPSTPNNPSPSPSPSPAPTPEPNYNAATGNAIVDRAYSWVGRAEYVWGGCAPGAFDCSGFVSYCLTGSYNRLGTTYTFLNWPRVQGEPQPGDVAVNSGHTGIYIGGGQMIHAATYGVGVIVGPVQSGMVFVRY